MRKLFPYLLAVAILGSSHFALSQHTDRDSIDTFLKRSPFFTIFKDNYLITGIPLGEKTNRHTADAKIQISFKHRLTDAVLPFNTYVFITYTQKSFWSVYQASRPFSGSNYNPAIGLDKVIFLHGKYSGVFSIEFEHESNGRDSIYSREWNRITCAYATSLSKQTNVVLYAWVPFYYKIDNPDLIQYTGYGEVAFNWKSKNQNLELDVSARKGARRDWTGSLQTQLSYRIAEKANQYISLQWFTGYAENLINYDHRTNMLRLGFVIKPSKFIN